MQTFQKINYTFFILLFLLSFQDIFAQKPQWDGEDNTTDQIWREGNVGIGIDGLNQSIVEKLELSGAIRLGNSSGNGLGTIQWNGTIFQGRTASGWSSLMGYWDKMGNDLYYYGNIHLNEGGIRISVTTPQTGSSNSSIDQTQYGLNFKSQDGYSFYDYEGINLRIRINANGNIGIGDPNPALKLTVAGMIRINTNINSYLQIGALSTGDNFAYISSAGQSAGTGLKFETPNSGSTSGVTRMTISNSGNVGIGTTVPLTNLHLQNNNGSAVTLANNVPTNESLLGQIIGRGNSHGINSSRIDMNIDGSTWSGGHYPSRISFWTTSNDAVIVERMRIDNLGNVGIGTTNPTEKLSVNGKIRAKEIIVNTGWFDFVFEDDYTLRTLSEVEAFVKANKHLPEIPTAKEVEENGVSVGEMQSKLLQKIEELTLYIIEQEKRIKTLETKK